MTLTPPFQRGNRNDSIHTLLHKPNLTNTGSNFLFVRNVATQGLFRFRGLLLSQTYPLDLLSRATLPGKRPVITPGGTPTGRQLLTYRVY